MILAIAFIAVAVISFMVGKFFGSVHIDDDAQEPIKGTLMDSNLNKAGNIFKRPSRG